MSCSLNDEPIPGCPSCQATPSKGSKESGVAPARAAAIRRMFARLIEISGQERVALLDDFGSRHPECCKELHALLDAAEKSGSFLEASIGGNRGAADRHASLVKSPDSAGVAPPDAPKALSPKHGRKKAATRARLSRLLNRLGGEIDE